MNVKLFFAKVGLVCKQASPEILTGGGIILGIAALIIACSKMKQTEKMNEEIHEEIEAEELRNKQEPDRKTHVAICIKIGAKAVWKWLKIFWLPLMLEILSILSIWYAHGIMVKRNAALVQTAFMLTQQLESYRERVKNKVGEEVENDLFYNLTNEKIGTQIEMLENGKTKKAPVYNKIVENGAEGPFCYIFDRSNHNYVTIPGANLDWLQWNVRAAQDILQSRATKNSDGWYWAWELERALGFDPKPESFGWGWRFSKNNPLHCDTIDIGIFDKSNEIVQRFQNGFEPAIPLHFNCHPLNPNELMCI